MGRSITLFEEVYPEKKLGNRLSEADFLHTLKSVLPKTCKPIIITDAGFRNPWFKAVLALGWDFIGRIRNDRLMRLGVGNCDTPWFHCRETHSWGKERPKFLGHGVLAKKNPLAGLFYLYSGKKKNRMSINKWNENRTSTESRMYAKGQKEPWLLFSSIEKSPSIIISYYRKRMQIEEGFRDLKNTRNGLSMRESRTKGIKRLSILLLIAMLGTIALFALGIYGKLKGIDTAMQTNTERNRNVLSLLFIGTQVLKKRIKIPIKELKTLLALAPWVRWELKIC